MGYFITENIKYMAISAYKACGQFCIYNELCKLARVQTHSDDKMISPIDPINASTIRRFQQKQKSTEAQQKQENNQIEGNVCNTPHSTLKIIEKSEYETLKQRNNSRRHIYILKQNLM